MQNPGSVSKHSHRGSDARYEQRKEGTERRSRWKIKVWEELENREELQRIS